MIGRRGRIEHATVNGCDAAVMPESAESALRERLSSAGLDDYADHLVNLMRPSARLVTGEQTAEDAIGTSRFGGMPDAPDGFAWPSHNGTPLSFIAQFRLADFTDQDPDGLLPAAGHLSFFYEATTQEAWGFDPKDSGASRVYYFPEDTDLHRAVAPSTLAEEGCFNPLEVGARPEWTPAPWESFDVELVGMTIEEGHRYAEALWDDEDDGPRHRLLGNPDPVQGDMQVECQLVTNGLYCGDSSGYRSQRAASLRDAATDWRLLLQVDSQDELNMMWGDVGRIYFWIKQDDLIARRWDKVWTILQCG